MVAIQYTLRCKVGSLFWSGLPCSAHVWISRGTTCKSKVDPRGDVTKPSVAMGNLLCARNCLLLLLCACRQVWWALEQPSSSVAPLLPYLRWIRHINRCMDGLVPATLVRFWMGLFGSTSVKRSLVTGNAPWVHMLATASHITKADREKHQWSSAGIVKKTIEKNPRKKMWVSGGPRLKGTQSYPSAFCSRIASLHKTWCKELNYVPTLPEDFQMERGPLQQASPDFWADADLEPCVAFLRSRKEFKPRKGVPMSATPLGPDELKKFLADHVYMHLQT
ncbi:unnamed protein product [Effrenium voratum]|nr:unnamed protein product [Effrenium voratum]